ncbi:MAG TPA: response regulator [Verrucomicrobiae bacterium]|nr:response regulator [Verrucomicrobiae bacterium]
MLIRTKLLLLALIPLPVLLVLGLAALLAARAQWTASEQLAAGLAFVEISQAAAGAAIARRDAETAIVARSSRGLEALMMEGGGEPGTEDVEPAGDAVSAVLTQLGTVSLDTIPAVLREGARSLVAYLDELQRRAPPVNGARLHEVSAGYDPLVRQASVLPELLAADAGDLARGLSALATLERMSDALAKERFYVRYAIETNTMPPQLLREFIANQGLLAFERSLLEEVFADDARRRGIASAFEVARASGRDGVLLQLQGLADRQDQLSLLTDALGYGGLIHHFKNFTLGGDAGDRSEFEASATAAEALIAELLAGPTLSEIERADGRLVAAKIGEFRRRTKRAAELRAQGMGAERIDSEVRIRDEEAQRALDRLASFRSNLSPEEWDALTRQLVDNVRALSRQLTRELRAASQLEKDAHRRRTWALSIGLALTLLLLGSFAALLYFRLTDGIRALVQEFERVAATGDVQTRSVVQGADELAQLNRSVIAVGLRLQSMADVAEGMAAGDLAANLEPLSPQDRLAHAMAALGKSARGVVQQAQSISAGDYATRIEPRSAQDTLAFALADMGQALRKFRDDTQQAHWLSAGQLRVLNAMGNTDTPEALGQSALAVLSEFTGAPMGMVHFAQANRTEVIARFGVANVETVERVAMGEGLVGRALRGVRTEVFAPLPANYLRLKSGLGSADVAAVTLTPLRASRERVGVLELGWLMAPDARMCALLDAVAESLGLALSSADARVRTQALLEETSRQAERLREQQEELRQSNEELEEQAQLLRQSEEALKGQREELQGTNEELIEKTNLLQRQREQLERTATDLALATKYKSEFLANMSHELRTPLNSLLILSRSLANNEEGNLTAEQVQSAAVIHDGGRDLLNLINDILDLSKVEAGRLDVHPIAFEIGLMVENLRRQFEPVARDKKVALNFVFAEGAPAEILSDRQRVEQILRNLLSNALKFTEKGSVTLTISSTPTRAAAGEPIVPFVAFAVDDTGIGIPEDKLELIFQAFQQADGSTSRRFGGTGLGLTIARQMASLLGGAVRASSKPGQGSCFTLVLPQSLEGQAGASDLPPASPMSRAEVPPPAVEMFSNMLTDPAPVEDDRDQIGAGERSMLIVEDDLRFAMTMRDVVRKRGYKCVVANDGASGLRLARRLLPSAILLDLKLPDLDGQRVLDILKWSSSTRHIPVHVISAMEPTNEPLRQGAIGFLHKPAGLSDLQQVVDRLEATLTTERRTVLVIEDDRGSQAAIRALLENPRTEIVLASTAAEAAQKLSGTRIDCIVLDLSLPDADGIGFLEQLRRDSSEHPPVVIYTGRDLSPDEHRRLSELAQSIVIKGAASPDRLVDDVLLFLHAVEADLPDAQKQAVARLHSGHDAFDGKKILIVDDDLRNVFALSGLLRKRGLEVLVADNGQMALERLNENPTVAAVLMDIMMPVMDGFEAMRRIRADGRFHDLPVIAVTAKAMAEDRRRCMEAGASDYLSKPIELDALLAMLRVWLTRAP